MSDPGTRQRKHAIRTRNSCNLCRKMKIRCDRQGGKCSNCSARGIPCEVTLAETGKPKLTKGEYLSSIEGRILRMEALLKSSGIITNSSPMAPLNSPSPSSEGQVVLTPNNKLSNLVIKDSGKNEYIGPSSGFALLSPRGLAWAREKTGSNRLGGIPQQLKRPRPLWPAFDGRSWWPEKGFTGHTLPCKEIADLFVTHFFNTFNATFPLFDRNVFYSYFERHYSSDPPTNKSWYGAFNVVLSIGFCTAKDTIGLDSQMENISPHVGFSEWPWKLFQNAATVLLDIMFTDSDLMGVQTVIGMAFILQAITNPEGAFVLIGTAARLAHAMGLHRWLEGFGLSQAELEQRRRVYWVIYVIEKSTCLRIGRPSAINDEDIGLELPPQDLDVERGGIRIPSMGDRKYYPFRAMCSIALIEGKVYSELYSAKSQTITPDEKLRSVGRLDRDLQDWKDSIPTELRPEHEIQCERDEMFPILMLHFSYYNCLTAIHRVSVHHGSWAGRDDELDSNSNPDPPSPELLETTGLNPRVYASYTLCLSAARTIIYLTVNYLDSASDPQNTLIWIALYFPISACLTIFAHILQSPLDPKSESDLGLLERTLEYLRRPSKSQTNGAAFLLLDVIGGLLVIAREHVMNFKMKGAPSSSDTVISNGIQVGEGAPDASFQSPGPSGIQGSSNGHPISHLDPNVPSDYSSNAPPCSWTPPTPSSFLPLTNPDSALMTTPDLSQFDFSTFMNSDGFLLADEHNHYGWE